MLNEHVLEIDPSTPEYEKVINYAGMGGMSGNGGDYKCLYTGGSPWPRWPDRLVAGYRDGTSTTPNTDWPHGTCCNDGGACSNPAANTDRYVLEFSSSAARNQARPCCATHTFCHARHETWDGARDTIACANALLLCADLRVRDRPQGARRDLVRAVRAAVDLHHGATRRCCSAAPLPPVFSARESDDMLLCP